MAENYSTGSKVDFSLGAGASGYSVCDYGGGREWRWKNNDDW
jgi:hypothetical protein